MNRYEVTIEIHGRAFTLTKSARTYYDMVSSINEEFGSALILKATDIN